MRMTRMVNIVVLLGILLGGAHLFASKQSEQIDTADAADRIARQASERLAADGIPGMVAALKQHCAGSEADLDQLDRRLHDQRAALIEKCGNPLGKVELLRKEALGRSLVQFVYLEKLERHAMVWRLTFYRAQNDWRLCELKWDDKPWTLFP